MARKTFRQYAHEISPTVLQSEEGERLVVGAVSLTFDSLAEHVTQSVRARLLNNPQQPADALTLMAEERLSPRYAIDTEATHRARVKAAHSRWREGGSEQGIRKELEAFGLSGISFVYNDDWDWDSDPDNWSRFWVVITGHPWTGPRELGEGYLLDGTWTLGSNATPEEVDTVRKIVRRWKAPEWICSHIVIVFDEATWAAEQPNGTWDKPWNRSASACYWAG